VPCVRARWARRGDDVKGRRSARQAGSDHGATGQTRERSPNARALAVRDDDDRVRVAREAAPLRFRTLIGTAIAPAIAAPKRAIDHSGRCASRRDTVTLANTEVDEEPRIADQLEVPLVGVARRRAPESLEPAEAGPWRSTASSAWRSSTRVATP
jgi:hypothetical protein